MVAVALGTGLREHEIAALDVGDVLHDDGRVRRRIALRTFKRSSTEPATQDGPCLLTDHERFKNNSGNDKEDNARKYENRYIRRPNDMPLRDLWK